MNPAPAFPDIRGAESGQALMLAVTIGLILLIGVAIIVFVNQEATRHLIARSQGMKSQSVAEEGISYAIQELSINLSTWKNALAGTFPADCNSGNAISTAADNKFKLYCSTGTAGGRTLTSYQMAVTVVALESGRASDTARPVRAIRAILSRRTLGADLINNMHSAAALQMVRQPTVVSPGALDVHWGPIVCLDASQDAANNPSVWTLPAPIDAGRYPRKFSVGGITGATPLSRSGTILSPGSDSDQKEYWAHAPINPPPIIDEPGYIQQAQSETTIPQPVSGSPSVPLAATGCLTAGCGFFRPASSGDTVVFGGGYAPPSGAVIYVDGSAEFDQIAMDNVTFIVTGLLTIKDSLGGSPMTLNVPTSAPLEYPYAPASQPCRGLASCVSPSNVPFRGFLYVKGNINVNSVGWTMAGALMVGDPLAPIGTGGMLIIPGAAAPADASLTLYYDDAINHGIRVKPISAAGQIKVVQDSMQDVPAF